MRVVELNGDARGDAILYQVLEAEIVFGGFCVSVNFFFFLKFELYSDGFP